MAPERDTPVSWSAVSSSGADQRSVAPEDWWTVLRDPAINALVESAFADSPTLAEALSRVDEAQAILGINATQRLPSLGASASVTRARAQNTAGQATNSTLTSTSASVGPIFNWEIDLFGRVRHSVEAAQSRLNARTAEAVAIRLSLAADVANGVLALRACENSHRVFVEDIASRERTLKLTLLRLAAGFAAPTDEARARSGIAMVQTNLAAQIAQCARQTNALVALSGQDASSVQRRLNIPAATPFMPQAPASMPELPASVLTNHPSIIAADLEAAAAWAEIGVARASRLPQLDLAAILAGQWVRATGSAIHYTTWSVGPTLSGTLFDGGAGAANVDAAEARYRRTVAALQHTLRTTVQDVEDALAAQTSAKARAISAREAVAAAETLLQASEAQWRAGAISLFELEDSHRQFSSAQDAAITAGRDQAQAWVTLVKATGGAITFPSEHIIHD